MQLISVTHFCTQHNINLQFIQQLTDCGLVALHSSEPEPLMSEDSMPALEKFIRLHYDLDINIEGLQAVHHLLEQIEVLQQQNRALKERLQLFEEY